MHRTVVRSCLSVCTELSQNSLSYCLSSQPMSIDSILTVCPGAGLCLKVSGVSTAFKWCKHKVTLNTFERELKKKKTFIFSMTLATKWMVTGWLLITPAIGYYGCCQLLRFLECFLEHCYEDSRVVANWSLHFSSFVNDFINRRSCLRARSVSKAINTCWYVVRYFWWQ